MKRLQVFLMMFFLNICLAQDITLKKLYDGIEDMKLEVNTPLSTRDYEDTRYLAENRKLSNARLRIKNNVVTGFSSYFNFLISDNNVSAYLLLRIANSLYLFTASVLSPFLT